MLRLIAFSTSLITILGNVFTSLRHSRYKEFVKHVGRTIRYVLLHSNVYIIIISLQKVDFLDYVGIMYTHCTYVCNCALLSCAIIGLCISDSNAHVIYSSDRGCHTQLVDVLMKTYTSEAVFLLTTFVNMARSRSAENDEERLFINTVTREIFEVQWNPSNPDILEMMSCLEKLS